MYLYVLRTARRATKPRVRVRLLSRYFTYPDDSEMAAEDDEKVSAVRSETDFLCVGGMPSYKFPSSIYTYPRPARVLF